jgi:hypothetical protein
MTKQAEIEALEAFVLKLGADSYCGPWLLGELPAIRAAILDDFGPAAGGARNLFEARRQAAAIVEDAKRQAAAIVEDTTKRAAAMDAASARGVDRARLIMRACDEAERGIREAFNAQPVRI